MRDNGFHCKKGGEGETRHYELREGVAQIAGELRWATQAKLAGLKGKGLSKSYLPLG